MKSHRLSQLYAIYAITFSVYFAQSVPYPVVPLFAEARHASIVMIGLIVLGNFVGAAVLSIPLGLLSDRVSRRAVVLIGISISSFSLFLLTFANDPTSVLIL